MSTRVGPYIFDIDLKDMSVEKLQFLKSGCDCFIKQKHAEQIEREFTELNLRAHAWGFDLVCQESDSNPPQVLNVYNFKVKERE